jgi:hypothetical protein
MELGTWEGEAAQGVSQSATQAKDNTPKWTVMVFMGADSIKGNAPLRDAARDDLEEMAQVGSDGPLNIFVQVHEQEGVARRGHIHQGPVELYDVPKDESEPAGGLALERFISWAMRTAGHDGYNTNHHTMLVLWGHAYDFALGRERKKDGTVDALDFAELSDVLQRLQKKSGITGAKLDILGFDVCDVATAEMACQLEPFAKYLVGSQIGVPIPGWPYDRILERLRIPYGRPMSPPEFGAFLVRRFCESYGAVRPVSLSLLDLSRVPALFERAGDLSDALAETVKMPDTREWIGYLFERSQTAAHKPYVDLADLCLTLARESGDETIREKAEALGDFLISPQPPLVGLSEEGVGRPFVVEHGRNAGYTARLNGVSIYAPHLVLARDYEAVRPLYQNFVFAQRTRWSEVVHTFARLS